MSQFEPRYSHGGSTVGTHTAVAGTATGGGRPIFVYGSVQDCAMNVTISGSGGTATVTIEASGGALDSTGNPASTSWVDQSDDGTGWDLTVADPTTWLYKLIPATRAPLWRTKILAIAGGATVTSSIAFINTMDQNGLVRQTPASYPSVTSTTTAGS